MTWIESHATALGVFDVNYCCKGVEGWIELKAGPDVDIRTSQIQWSKERIRAGGWPLLLIQWDDVFMIVPAGRASALWADPSRENIEALASTMWRGQIDPKQLVEVMIDPRKEYGQFAKHIG